METTNVAATPVAQETMEKATAIIRARLPKLSEAGLNYEKRADVFFKGVLEVDEETGEEKIFRRVCDPADYPTDAAEEIEAKKAAGVVCMYEARLATRQAVVEKAQKQLDDAMAVLDQLNADLEQAIAVVDAFDLPEKEKKERVKLSQKVDNLQSENDKLRAMLIAAGINPDE